MKSRSELVPTILRVLFGPVLFAAFVITLGATACFAGASATTEPSATATATATATASATPAATATATVTATATASPTLTPTATATATSTPQPAALVISSLACTDLHHGAYLPEGPNRTLTMVLTVTNSSGEDIELEEAAGGGGLVTAEYLGEDGSVLLSVEGSPQEVTLAAGESYQAEITQGDPAMGAAESCRAVLRGPDGEEITYSGEQSAEVEQIFAP